MLKINKLNTYYGESHILKDVSLSIGQGQVVIMLGPNGHGKSTLLKSICGLVDKMEGRILYDGQDITGLSSDKIVNLGVTYIAENRELFPYMTVKENLKLGAYAKSARRNEKKNQVWVASLFSKLMQRHNQMASTMSGGEAKMLAIARGLMSDADLLCIDEPALGLQPSYRVEISKIIGEISRQGKTVFIVEQNIPQLIDMADKIYIMEEGAISFEGGREDALNNEQLREIFLGL
jgi:branched-chain amino acid transport system ATP-binding protein